MSQDEELSRVWGHVVSTLESSPDITPRQIAFVRLARPLGLLDGTLLLAVGNDLTKDYLESRVRGEVTAALSTALDREARFAITVDPELAEDAPPALRVVGSGRTSATSRTASRATSARPTRPTPVGRRALTCRWCRTTGRTTGTTRCASVATAAATTTARRRRTAGCPRSRHG